MTFDDVQFVPPSLVASTQILAPGDIAVCMSNGSKSLVGKCAPYTETAAPPHTVGAFCSIFKPHETDDADFVLQLFRSETYQQIVDLALAGSAINNLKNSSIETAVFKIPVKRDYRRRIALILRGIDTAIEKTEALIDKYQRIKTGLMHDLFTRGVLPDGQLRPRRDEAPALYRKSVVEWVPAEWEVSGLSTKGRPGTQWIRTGPFGSSLKGEHWRQYGRPVITIGALGVGEFIESDLLFVSEEDARRLADFQLVGGDVVFSRVADVGRSVVVRDDHVGWIMSSNLMRIAVDATLVRPDFLQMLLAGDARVKAQIRMLVNSGGRDVANSDVLNRLRFAWPSPGEQDRIIAACDRVVARVNGESRRLVKLQAKKLGLMQDLLTGKVPVKVDEPVAETADA